MWDGLCKCFQKAAPNSPVFNADYFEFYVQIMPIVEAMCDGAVKAGAPRELSYRLTAAALKGAAEILLQDTSHPAVWKDRICTPGGPTIAGIEVMEEHAVRHAMMAAVAQAFKRSKELDQGLQ